MTLPALCEYWYEFTNWTMERTEKFPKNVRLTLALRIDNLALDILEDFVKASYTSRQKKLQILADANRKLECLRMLFRMAHDRKFLNHRSFEYSIRKMTEAGNMLGGWMKERCEKSR